MLRFRDLGVFVFEFWVLRFRDFGVFVFEIGCFVFDLGVFVFDLGVLCFRDLGASFSSFGSFVLRSSFSSASFSKLPFSLLHVNNQDLIHTLHTCTAGLIKVALGIGN